MRRLPTVALSVVTMLFVVVPSASATLYTGTSMPRDYIREEVLRLINGERAYKGTNVYKLDTFLAGKAQDQPIRCPNDASKIQPGRAKSVAEQNVIPAPHPLPLCKSYTVLSVFPYWNYSDYRAEILAVNTQDMSYRRFDYGCPVGTSGLTCNHSQYTYAPYTAAQAVRMWMNSSTHRAKMLGSYRFAGCGVWQGGSAVYGGYTYRNTRWYSCIFGNTGPTANRDAYAPTLTNVSVNGAAYVAGMSVGVSTTVSFTLTDTGGPLPRVSDWWAYLDGSASRDRTGFKEGAFDAAGGSASVSFTVDLSTLTAGAHKLTLVGRAMDTRQVTTTLDLNVTR